MGRKAMENNNEHMKVFSDSIHGHIELDPLLVTIIDTPQFQRLRYIKQLGGGYFVFPGASHNRFEHSIGVAHLAGKLVKNLHDSLAKEDEDKKEKEQRVKDEVCVQIAGLCHDLGHGPFSHIFEVFMKKKDLKWEHAAMSVKMFDDLIEEKVRNEDCTIEKYLKDKAQLDDTDFYFIKELIYGPNPPTQKHKVADTHQDGQWSYKGRTKDKSYLYEIVANKRNGIDVDKMDYFSRDCHHLGMKSNFSHERFMVFARVCTDENNEQQICMRDKEALNMYELFHVRFLLHSNAYQHRVTKVVELMIMDALSEADSHFKLGKEKVSISAAAENPKAYLHLTDDIFQEILRSSEEELSPAAGIIKRIHERKLYKFIGGQTFDFKVIDEELKAPLETWLKIVESNNDVKEFMLKNKKDNLHVDFDVVTIKLNYGKGKENPIKSLRFYSKDGKMMPKDKECKVSHLLLEKFEEYKVMIFYKGHDANVEDVAKAKIDEFWEKLRKL